jgi:hypothetical protein
MIPAEATARYRRAPDVAWVESDDRVALLRLADPGADPVALEASAAAVWLAVEDGGSVDEVVARVAAAYAVEPVVVAADVERFLAELVSWGLVEPWATGVV